MYTLTPEDKPPTATRHLNRRVLCGHCNYKCCNGKSLVVLTTEQESEELGLPVVFPQDGHCRCLTPTGCEHGERRPISCQMFPLQVNKRNQLVVSYWSILNCPTAKDYDFVGMDGGRYTYQRRAVSGAKANNSDVTLSLKEPLEQFPTAIECGATAVSKLWGQDGADQIKHELAVLNDEIPIGFGLNIRQT